MRRLIKQKDPANEIFLFYNESRYVALFAHFFYYMPYAAIRHLYMQQGRERC